MTATIVILEETLPAYRVPLFTEMRRHAEARGIEIKVLHGKAPSHRGERLNSGYLSHARVIRNCYLPIRVKGTRAVWQPALRACLQADVVVVDNANRMLINYVLLLTRRAGGPRVAFWGHGRDIEADSTSAAATFKARLATSADWWFAYTSGVARYLESLGVPESRITMIGNTIDTASLQADIAAYGDRNAMPRARCAFLGGLYDHKRLDLLFEAADLVSRSCAEFELVIAGAGEQRANVEQYVARRRWARYVGQVDARAKAELLASSRLLLMPGAVGLVALDALASGVPLVTMADASHGPEIEYIRSGTNGIVLPPASTAADFARATVDVLNDERAWKALNSGALRTAEQHSIDAAAERFVDGIETLLASGRSTVGTPHPLGQ